MRKLQVDDIYLLSQIADKMEFVMPDSKGKTQEQLGGELIMQLFKKLHKAKNEVNSLIENVTEKKVADMSIKEMKDTIIELFKQDGILDFFK